MSTIFEKIINKEIPSEIVFEDPSVIAIKDIMPVAPVHILIIPKKPFTSLQAVPKEELPLIATCLSVAQDLAKSFGVAEHYRLVTNHGKEAGQSVFHLHFHLIGGKKLGPIA